MNFGLRIICLLIGYGFGCIQWAFLIGKSRGIDIRSYGSGNSGTTNAMRVMGKNTGLAVFFLDLGKGLLCLLLIGLLFGGRYPDKIYLLKMWAFAGVVLGHDYPFYMGFRGGKGVAVMAGFVFGFYIGVLPIAAAAFFLPFLLTHYVSLGSLCVYAACFLAVVAEGAAGWYPAGGPAALAELSVIMGLLTVLAYYRHRTNIAKLRNGSESRTYLFRKENKG